MAFWPRFGVTLAVSLSLLSGCARGGPPKAPTVELLVRGVASAPPIETTSTPTASLLVVGPRGGDIVEVEWHGSWYPAIVLDRRAEGWLVRYDGFTSDWDEVVDADRIRDRQDVPLIFEPEDEVDSP